MAAVGALMDDSYADRAKKAAVASNLRNNPKQMLSQSSLEPPGAISSSNSDTLDSSPAPSTSQTPATSLVLPPSVPMSSASSDQASPARPLSSLPPRNAWSQQNPWKTPTKQPSTSNTATSITNLDKHQPPPDMSPLSARSELHPSPVKTATKPAQKNADPFVVNYNLNVPSLTDASNWPQVGETTTHQHRVRPSVSSTSSTVVTPASLPPPKPTGDNEMELSPSKKAKGEKTKWVPIPPKELQAAVDEVTRQHHGGSSSKSHSPRVNGRGRRLNEDTSDSKQEGRTPSRSNNRSSPVRAGNTRHDRNPSLTVPSSGSSRRVSPLHMTSSLPSPASNLILEHTPDSPSHRRLSPLVAAIDNLHPQTNSDHQAMQNNRLQMSSSPQISMPTPALFPNRSTTHSRNPSQHAHPAPAMGYPVWAPPMYPIPYYSYPATYPPPVPSQHPIPNESTTQRPPSPRIRQKRKRRPNPREAPPFAGYRGTVLETSDEMVTINMEFGNQDILETKDLEPSSEGTIDSAVRIRTPWWSLGMPDSRISKWLQRDPDLLAPRINAEALGKESGIIFGALSSGPPSIAAESPVENAILQNSNLPGHLVPPPEPSTGYPSWPAPGAGPSSMDIGLAMGMPPHSAHIPPPLYMGMPQPPPSHMPSPASAVSRPDWPARDDIFASTPMQQQPAPMYPYPSYPPYSYPQMNGYPYSGYSSDSNTARNPYGAEGRGGRPWRDDRYSNPRGGGGRGRYPSRGRGFRGAYGGPRSGSQYLPPGGMPQSPYPASPSQPPNATTVYIPDPTLHQPMYPYPPQGPPQSFAGYRPPVQPAPEQNGATPGRPPSPKPMTQLTIPLEHTQYKLLGQIEYYFSNENVAKDMYLREQMDSKGWVSLQILQSFPRIQSLNVSDELIKETLRWSNYVEVRQNHVRMSRNEWQRYVRQDATESTVSDVPEQAWYPPPVFYPAYPAGGMPMYPPAPHPYPYYPPPPHANPYAFPNGIADHILRRPEERMMNGNGVLESGTSVGESFDSTPHTTEGEDAETSEEDVVFLIGDPSPMTRPTNPQTAIDQPIKKMSL